MTGGYARGTPGRAIPGSSDEFHSSTPVLSSHSHAVGHVSRCQNKNCLRFWCKSTNAYADFILWKLVWKWATPILIWKNIILPIHLSQWPFSGPKKTHFQTDPNIISSWWDIYIYIPFLLLVLSHPSEKKYIPYINHDQYMHSILIVSA